MPIFKRKQKKKEENELPLDFPLEKTDTTNEGMVETTLSFHPDWELTSQEKYVYMFKHKQLPLLKPNQISITGMKLLEYQDGFVVVAFLRNTLDKAIRFDAVDLLLLDETGQAVAKKQFELDGMEELAPFTCRPWRFLFSNEDKLVEKMPEDGWTIAFELKQPREEHKLQLHESWENQISPLHREHLEQLVSTLPPLQEGEINFLGLECKITSYDNLAVTVLIRNGSDKNINLEQLPLIVEDAQGDIICQGGFKLDKFMVQANSSKPWTFIFPNNLISKPSPDLSKWRVYPPNK